MFRRFFGEKNAARNRSLEIEEPLLSYLNKYSWPGNFRQLESFVERMMALSHGRYVEKDVLKMLMAELPEGEVITADVKTDNRRMGDARHDNEKNIYHVRGSLSDVEEQMIQQAYERCKGDIAAMVDLLDISRTTLWRKMKKMNLM